MANPKDIQKEIDALKKEVDAALDEFDDIRDEFDEVNKQGADKKEIEKVDTKLTKQYREIVRLRHKGNLISNNSKLRNDSDLVQLRSDIEKRMRYWQTDRKDVKEQNRQYSIKGLEHHARQEAKNPKQKTMNWLLDTSKDLYYVADRLEFALKEQEQEQGASYKKKRGTDADPLLSLRVRIARVRYEKKRVDLIVNQIETDDADFADAEELQSTLLTFLENCEDLDFEENEEDEMKYDIFALDLHKFDPETCLDDGSSDDDDDNGRDNDDNDKTPKKRARNKQTNKNDDDDQQQTPSKGSTTNNNPNNTKKKPQELQKSQIKVTASGSASAAVTPNHPPKATAPVHNAWGTKTNLLGSETTSRQNSTTSDAEMMGMKAASSSSNNNNNNDDNSKESRYFNPKEPERAVVRTPILPSSPSKKPSSSSKTTTLKPPLMSNHGNNDEDDQDDNNNNDNDHTAESQQRQQPLQGISALGIIRDEVNMLQKALQLESETDFDALSEPRRYDLLCKFPKLKNTDRLKLICDAVQFYKHSDGVEKIRKLWACAKNPNGNPNDARIAVATGANVDARSDNLASDKDTYPTPFCEACKNQNYELIKVLAGSPSQFGLSCQKNVLNHNRETQLLRACLDDSQEELVQVLMELGCDPNLCDKQGRSPLFVAAENNYMSLARIICETKPSTEADGTTLVNLNLGDKHGTTPLMIAASFGYREIVEILLRSGASVSASAENDGATALHVACQQQGSGPIQCIDLLLQYNANVNSQDFDGKTPLMIAIESDNVEAVKRILGTASSSSSKNQSNNNSLNLEITCPDEDEKTALFIACDQALRIANDVVVNLLLNAGASVSSSVLDRDINVVMHCAAEGNDVALRAVLGHILRNFKDNNNNNQSNNNKKKNNNNNTSSNTTATASEIINQVDEDNRTALNHACRRRQFSTALLLAQTEKCNFEVEDNTNLTALAIACETGAADIARLLLEAGANAKWRNNSYASLTVLAKDRGQAELVPLLNEHGTKSFTKNKKYLGVVPNPFDKKAAAAAAAASASTSGLPPDNEVLEDVDRLLGFIYQNDADSLENFLNSIANNKSPAQLRTIMTTPSQKAQGANVVIFATQGGRNLILDKMFGDERRLFKDMDDQNFSSTEEAEASVGPYYDYEDRREARNAIVNFMNTLTRSSPMSMAVAVSQISCFPPLISFGADVNLEHNPSRFRPLHFAAISGNIKAIRALLQVQHNTCIVNYQQPLGSFSEDEVISPEIQKLTEDYETPLVYPIEELDLDARSDLVPNQEKYGKMTAVMACAVIPPSQSSNLALIPDKVQCIRLLLKAACSQETEFADPDQQAAAASAAAAASSSSSAASRKAKKNASKSLPAPVVHDLTLSQYFSRPELQCPPDFSKAVEEFLASEATRQKQMESIRKQVQDELNNFYRSEEESRGVIEDENVAYLRKTKKAEMTTIKALRERLKLAEDQIAAERYAAIVEEQEKKKKAAEEQQRKKKLQADAAAEHASASKSEKHTSPTSSSSTAASIPTATASKQQQQSTKASSSSKSADSSRRGALIDLRSIHTRADYSSVVAVPGATLNIEVTVKNYQSRRKTDDNDDDDDDNGPKDDRRVIQPPGIEPDDGNYDRKNKSRPLHEAIEKSDMFKAITLCRAGAVNTRDWRGATPLYYACLDNKMTLVTLLLKQGANANIGEGTRDSFPLFVSIREKREAVVEYLLKEAKVERERVSVDGSTPLLIAAHTNSMKIFKDLIKYGCDYNTQEQFTLRSCLHIACQYNYHEMAKYLIQLGAAVNLTDQDGRTALILASQFSDDPDVVRLLCRRKEADLEKACNQDATALAYAIRCGKVGNARVLLQYGADPYWKHASCVGGLKELADKHAQTTCSALLDEHEKKSFCLSPDEVEFIEVDNFENYLLPHIIDEIKKDPVQLKRYEERFEGTRYHPFDLEGELAKFEDENGTTPVETSSTATAEEKKAAEEEAAKKKQQQEDDRKKQEAEELERKKQEEAERKKREAENAEQKKKREEEERQRKAEEDAERQRKQEEDRKKKEAEEAERKRKQEEERKKKEAEDAERKRQQEEERKKKAEEEAERKRQQEEERKKKEAEEAERKRKQDEERKKKAEEEAARKKKEEDERIARERLNVSNVNLVRDLIMTNRYQNHSTALLQDNRYEESLEACDKELDAVSNRKEVLLARKAEAENQLKDQAAKARSAFDKSIRGFMKQIDTLTKVEAYEDAIKVMDIVLTPLRAAAAVGNDNKASSSNNNNNNNNNAAAATTSFVGGFNIENSALLGGPELNAKYFDLLSSKTNLHFLIGSQNKQHISADHLRSCNSAVAELEQFEPNANEQQRSRLVQIIKLKERALYLLNRQTTSTVSYASAVAASPSAASAAASNDDNSKNAAPPAAATNQTSAAAATAPKKKGGANKRYLQSVD